MFNAFKVWQVLLLQTMELGHNMFYVKAGVTKIVNKIKVLCLNVSNTLFQ